MHGQALQYSLPMKDSAMANDLTHPVPQDPTQINVTEAREVQYWSDTLRVSEHDLRMAVAAAGISTAAVSEHLGHAPH